MKRHYIQFPLGVDGAQDQEPPSSWAGKLRSLEHTAGGGRRRERSLPEEREGRDRVRREERMSGEGKGLQRCEVKGRGALSKEEERQEAAPQNHCPLPPRGGPGAFSSFSSLPARGGLINPKVF